MSAVHRSIALLVLLASLAGAQQPNTAAASLTFAAANGPPWPITLSITPSQVPATTLLPMHVSGAPFAPYAIGIAGGGVLPAGLPVLGCGLIDLDVGSAFAVLLDGIGTFGGGQTLIGSMAHTAANGISTWQIGILPTWSGAHLAAQGVILDPSNAWGYTLTAATDLRVL